ncbi:DMT family transporter [Sulfitobacter sp. JB4-11]|uniref:DMT family transporter n=1 Tax=Sulfitobacter rhodophyticola TaxID=3238304 RepID=UPI00351857D0
MSPNILGALLMMVSMACFTINDTLVKMTGGVVPLFQLIFLRGLLTSILVIGSRGRLGRLSFDLQRRDWALVGLRAMAEVCATFCFLSALFHMPLGNVTAILQALPLTVTLASALVLREALGWRRMTAIAIGLVGVLLIIKPGAEGFTVWSVVALGAVGFVTVRDLATRQLSPEVPSITVTLVSALTVMGSAGVVSLFQPWAPIGGWHATLIAGAAVFILGGYYFSVRVMRVGEVGFIAPFRYTGLVFALILGWLAFREWPDNWTLLGAAIVVGTGLFTLYRESKVSRR